MGLLGRRAAGIFSGDEGGAELLVPMFNGEKVSFILIQVEGAKVRGNNFPGCVVEDMHPMHVFSKGSPLHGKALCDIICVYMNLEESASLPTENPDTFFICEENESSQVVPLEGSQRSLKCQQRLVLQQWHCVFTRCGLGILRSKHKMFLLSRRVSRKY